MNGWIKYFSDGTKEVGLDKSASWSKGRLDSLVRVEMYYGDQIYALTGLGEYWQSDDFDVVIGSNKTDLIMKRIEKKLSNNMWFVFELDTLTGRTTYRLSENRI